MSTDRSSQRSFLSSRSGSSGSSQPSRSNFRSRGRPNNSSELPHGPQSSSQQLNSSSYRGTGQRYYGGSNAPYSRDSFNGSSYKSRPSGSGYFSSRDRERERDWERERYAPADAPSGPGATSTSSNRSYHPRSYSNQWGNPYGYTSRYGPRGDLRNDPRAEQRARYGSTATSSYYGTGSRQNSLNQPTLPTKSYPKEDFYDPYPSRDLVDKRLSYSNEIYPRRVEHADSAKWPHRTGQTEKPLRTDSRPSLIPKDFQDDYDDEADEELGRNLRELQKSQTQTPEPKGNSDFETEVHKGQYSFQNADANTHKNENILPKDELNLQPKLEGVETPKTGTILSAKSDTRPQELDFNEPPRAKDEESDSYEPETAQILTHNEVKEAMDEVDISPEKHISTDNPKAVQEALEAVEHNQRSLKEFKKLEESRMKSKNIIIPLKPPDSDIFPLPELDDKLWEFKNHHRAEVISKLPYLLKNPLKNVFEYPFYARNFLVHEQVTRPKLLKNLSIIKTNTFLWKASLVNEYNQRPVDWNRRLKIMEDQLAKLYPAPKSDNINSQNVEDDSLVREHELFTGRSTSRRGGRGDVAKTEAEFLEILKTLEEEDPLTGAQRVAALIPDMILDPLIKNAHLTNVNNLVLDKEEWANSMKTDGHDNFTQLEHEKFCEAFLSYPKRFGRISSIMGGLRTSRDCVLHYYRTKKTKTDYKQLLALKKKKKAQKSRGKRAKSKSTVATPITTTLETPQDSGDELVLDNFIPKEAKEEVYYTDTGRRRRVAAPVFDIESEKENTKVVSPEVSTTEQISAHSSIQEDVHLKRTSEGEAADQLTDTEDSLAADSQVVSGSEGPARKKVKVSKSRKVEAWADVNGAADSIDVPNSNCDRGKQHITSYWSVRDIELFMRSMREHGNNWGLIADILKTKTPIMVRNYFHRNAETQGWKDIVDAVNSKRPDQGASTFHRNPPLGVFTASLSVPSNVNLPPDTGPRQLATALAPATTSPVPFSGPLTHAQQSNGATAPASRSNPFSITSLLNPPSEEVKPTITELPTLGSFNNTIVQPSSNAPKPDQAKAKSPLSSVPSQQASLPQPLDGFNALLDAAETYGQLSTQSQESTETKNFESVRPIYGRDTPNYAGGYQASYSESSLRGDNTTQDVKQEVPRMSSSLKNILQPSGSAEDKKKLIGE